MKYKAIGFDYGGVIIGQPGSIFSSKICEILEINLETFRGVYFKNNSLLNKHRISYDEFWRQMLIEFGKPEKEKEIFDFLRSLPKEEINIEVVNLIKNLQAKGYKTGLFSNNSTRINKELIDFGIDKIFDVIMISEDIGHMKPEVEAFKLFFEKIGVNPNEAIFIDDTEMSLSTAKEIGYTPILFKNVDDLKKELIDLGVL